MYKGFAVRLHPVFHGVPKAGERGIFRSMRPVRDESGKQCRKLEHGKPPQETSRLRRLGQPNFEVLIGHGRWRPTVGHLEKQCLGGEVCLVTDLFVGAFRILRLVKPYASKSSERPDVSHSMQRDQLDHQRNDGVLVQFSRIRW